MLFIIDNRKYDTDNMEHISVVKKWFKESSLLVTQLFGTDIGRVYDCDLFLSRNGRWLLVHKQYDLYYAEIISEQESKNLLMHSDYKAYTRIFGELEEG